MVSNQALQRLYYASRRFLKRNSSTILTCIGAVGVVTTAVLTGKATPKAMQALEVAKKERNEDLTKLEVVQVAGPSYIPAAAVGLSTIICIFGANAISRRQQAALISAYALLENSYKEYQNKVAEMHGSEANTQIRDAIVKDKYEEADPPKPDEEKETCLFYEEHYGKFFESTKEDVLAAEYHFNRNFVLRGYACLNEFLDFLGVGPIEGGNVVGWSMIAGDLFYGYQWVDFNHELATLDDGLECYIIKMPFPPTADFLELDYSE